MTGDRVTGPFKVVSAVTRGSIEMLAAVQTSGENPNPPPASFFFWLKQRLFWMGRGKHDGRDYRGNGDIRVR